MFLIDLRQSQFSFRFLKYEENRFFNSTKQRNFSANFVAREKRKKSFESNRRVSIFQIKAEISKEKRFSKFANSKKTKFYIRQTFSHSSALIKPQSCIKTRRKASLKSSKKIAEEKCFSRRTSIIFLVDSDRWNETNDERRERRSANADRSAGKP